VEAELRKEPTANEGTSDSDEKVADNPEPGVLHNLTGQPSGNMIRRLSLRRVTLLSPSLIKRAGGIGVGAIAGLRLSKAGAIGFGASSSDSRDHLKTAGVGGQTPTSGRGLTSD
jgi:hypothetical protein